MKTYFNIYNYKTKKLVQQFIDENDVFTTFDNWVISKDNFLKPNEIKKHIIFFYTGSNIIDEQVIGSIFYDSFEKRFMYDFDNMIFQFLQDNHKHLFASNNMVWDESLEAYYFVTGKRHVCGIENSDNENHNLEVANVMDIINSGECLFLEEKNKFTSFIYEPDNEPGVLRKHNLIIKNLLKRCKICRNVNGLSIQKMIEGDFNCNYCNK